MECLTMKQAVRAEYVDGYTRDNEYIDYVTLKAKVALVYKRLKRAFVELEKMRAHTHGRNPSECNAVESSSYPVIWDQSIEKDTKWDDSHAIIVPETLLSEKAGIDFNSLRQTTPRNGRHLNVVLICIPKNIRLIIAILGAYAVEEFTICCVDVENEHCSAASLSSVIKSIGGSFWGLITSRLVDYNIIHRAMSNVNMPVFQIEDLLSTYYPTLDRLFPLGVQPRPLSRTCDFRTFPVTDISYKTAVSPSSGYPSILVFTSGTMRKGSGLQSGGTREETNMDCISIRRESSDKRGVLLTHENVLYRINVGINILEIDKASVGWSRTTPGFIDFYSEIFPFLHNGAAIYIPLNLKLQGGGFLSELGASEVTHLPLIPSLLLPTDAEYIRRSALRVVTCTASALFSTTASRFIRDLPKHIKFYNFYGSSETTGECLYHLITDYSSIDTAKKFIPIGRATSEDVKLSVTSEGCLAVEGPCVGLGYLCNSTSNSDHPRCELNFPKRKSSTRGKSIKCLESSPEDAGDTRRDILSENEPGSGNQSCSCSTGKMEGRKSISTMGFQISKEKKGSSVGSFQRWESQDLVELDSDGLWHFLGRSDRNIKISGIWINLDEIESLFLEDYTYDNLQCHPRSRLDSHAEGEIIVVFIETPYKEEEQYLTRKYRYRPEKIRIDSVRPRLRYQEAYGLKHRMRTKISTIIHKLAGGRTLPFQIWFVSELPRSPIKVDVEKLAQMYRLASSVDNNGNDECESPQKMNIYKIVAALLNLPVFGLNDDLILNHGLDSILMNCLNAELRIEFNFDGNLWSLVWKEPKKVSVETIFELINNEKSCVAGKKHDLMRKTWERKFEYRDKLIPVRITESGPTVRLKDIKLVLADDHKFRTLHVRRKVEPLNSAKTLGGETKNLNVSGSNQYFIPCEHMWSFDTGRCVMEPISVLRDVGQYWTTAETDEDSQNFFSDDTHSKMHRYSFSPDEEANFCAGAQSSTAKKDYIYTASLSRHIHCLHGGRQVWALDLKGPVQQPLCIFQGWGESSNCSNPNALNSLSKDKKLNTNIFDAKDDVEKKLRAYILVSTYAGDLICLDAITGVVIWNRKIAGISESITFGEIFVKNSSTEKILWVREKSDLLGLEPSTGRNVCSINLLEYAKKENPTKLLRPKTIIYQNYASLILTTSDGLIRRYNLPEISRATVNFEKPNSEEVWVSGSPKKLWKRELTYDDVCVLIDPLIFSAVCEGGIENTVRSVRTESRDEKVHEQLPLFENGKMKQFGLWCSSEGFLFVLNLETGELLSTLSLGESDPYRSNLFSNPISQVFSFSEMKILSSHSSSTVLDNNIFRIESTASSTLLDLGDGALERERGHLANPRGPSCGYTGDESEIPIYACAIIDKAGNVYLVKIGDTPSLLKEMKVDVPRMVFEPFKLCCTQLVSLEYWETEEADEEATNKKLWKKSYDNPGSHENPRNSDDIGILLYIEQRGLGVYSIQRQMFVPITNSTRVTDYSEQVDKQINTSEEACVINTFGSASNESNRSATVVLSTLGTIGGRNRGNISNCVQRCTCEHHCGGKICDFTSDQLVDYFKQPIRKTQACTFVWPNQIVVGGVTDNVVCFQLLPPSLYGSEQS